MTHTRDYQARQCDQSLRADLAHIADWIPAGSHVLDLGCGSGSLLSHLQRYKQVSGYGLEIDPERVLAAVRNGVDVLQGDIDQELMQFPAQSFDCVVMALAIQEAIAPADLLGEMLRIGRQAIVTFPNFANWRVRLHLACKGRMPMARALPHAWYDTPNIHLCTVRDFEALCAQQDITVLQKRFFHPEPAQRRLAGWAPNLFGEVAFYKLTA